MTTGNLLHTTYKSQILLVVLVWGVESRQRPSLVNVEDLKELQHLQALYQPHLPKDVNVLEETRQFLHNFAHLKAVADAAPDPPDRQKKGSNPRELRVNTFTNFGQDEEGSRVMVPAVNKDGIIVNPNGYEGPLADLLPAGVDPRRGR